MQKNTVLGVGWGGGEGGGGLQDMVRTLTSHLSLEQRWEKREETERVFAFSFS